MPINTDAYSVFIRCRNSFLRDAAGNPYDVDMTALSTTVLAMKYDCLFEVADLMRYLLHEEVL